MSKKPRSFQPVSEQMRAWSLALADEVAAWPLVETRSFFGFTALYRKQAIFGLLPRTRTLHATTSIAFKVENPSVSIRKRLESCSQLGTMEMQKARWFLFPLTSDGDLHVALEWLGIAYTAAGKKRPMRKKSH